MSKSQMAAASVSVAAISGALIIIAANPEPESILRAVSYGLTMLAGILIGAVLVMALRPKPNPSSPSECGDEW